MYLFQRFAQAFYILNDVYICISKGRKGHFSTIWYNHITFYWKYLLNYRNNNLYKSLYMLTIYSLLYITIKCWKASNLFPYKTVSSSFSAKQNIAKSSVFITWANTDVGRENICTPFWLTFSSSINVHLIQMIVLYRQAPITLRIMHVLIHNY